ncbi:hypothetical protein KBY91_28215 [Streptomyces sp. RK23]|uniref:DUF6271 family protein n=1 Tax=Streptomyces TaxID=1883 RepID=UPI001B36F0E6|nr:MULTISPECIES: DUF6271 family protein [unclassified Streptomyces]MBQ0964545.1 hypothetical protein [Streptomyces sp. RK74B]MBQ1007295.1 hypothetical protein [Streptomyces sp. RK23]
MRSICLTLPTNRHCPDTVTALGEEAAYAADHFDIDVHLLVLDSCPPADRAAHAAALRHLPTHPRITAHHLDEAAQRDFLTRVTTRSGSAKPELLLDLMLPDGLSYGACTNRAFLIAAALGCESVHRRDSDSRYQRVDGRTVFPVHHELLSLGERAADAAAGVTEPVALDDDLRERRVAMVGSSFVGELSVDIAQIRDADPAVYHDVVSLWAPEDWSAEQKRALVEESFTGAGTEPFTADRSLLTVVDPMRVDMCNIAFHGPTVSERVPLPPARDTIGSDYFLIHLVHDARLPGVLHNRNIVNYYTGERRTGPGFLAYQTRFAKFLLSMLYFHHVYDRMAEAGDALLDEHGRVRPAAVAALARESTALDTAENVRRLDALDTAYRRLGGRYTEFADLLAARRARLLDEARGDMADFALLTEAWESMVTAARATPVAPTAGQPR